MKKVVKLLEIDKFIFLLILAFFTQTKISFAQLDNAMNANRDYNGIRYSYIPFDITKYKPLTIVIDTFNICRIRNSGIERVRVYEFRQSAISPEINPNDSILYADLSYDVSDNIVFNKSKSGYLQNQRIRIPKFKCTLSHYRENNLRYKDTTIIKKYGWIKTISVYDSLGYLIQFKNIRRGPIKYNNSTGRNTKIEIIYSRDHKIVREYRYVSIWAIFPPESIEGMDESRFDNEGNVLSRTSFDQYGKWYVKYHYYYEFN